jgi:hypothetical protein
MKTITYAIYLNTIVIVFKSGIKLDWFDGLVLLIAFIFANYGWLKKEIDMQGW